MCVALKEDLRPCAIRVREMPYRVELVAMPDPCAIQRRQQAIDARLVIVARESTGLELGCQRQPVVPVPTATMHNV